MGKNWKKGNLTFKAFDAKHKSGGGGFIIVEGFHNVLRSLSTLAVHASLYGMSSGKRFWNQKNLESLKEEWRLMGKVIDLYHFKGNTEVYVFM